MEARRIRALRAVGERDCQQPDCCPALCDHSIRWRDLRFSQIAGCILQHCAVMALRRAEVAPRWATRFLAFSAFCVTPLAHSAMGPADRDIRLEISPRICTLTAKDRQCETAVHAQWRSAQEESLCLVIVARPEIKRCWENYSQG